MLRMKLDGEERFGVMDDALVGLVILVGEECPPLMWKSGGIYCKAMVL